MSIYPVKYSPPIEAGASFNPPNLAKDCILRASVSEAMGLYVYILATAIYVVKGKVSLTADGQFIPPP